MAYLHWLEPRPGQRSGTNGLCETVDTFHPEQGQNRDLLSPILLVPVLFSVNTLYEIEDFGGILISPDYLILMKYS